jgi:hypothetical protein
VSQTLLKDFFAKVETLRWDDHRYYHQCRINQSLHFVSALSFLVAYAVVWKQPALAGLIGWLVGMVTRQSGHIFFEPRGFDTIHQCSYAHKESIKAGFNMQRKAVLISIWLSLPVLLLISPSLFGLLPAWEGAAAFWQQLGTGWLLLGAGGLLLRTAHLVLLRGPGWALAWAYKILSDPFHNVAQYWRSPLALLRGERYDPLTT